MFVLKYPPCCMNGFSVPQFFITLNVCQHLDGKHAVFGRVCGGMGTVKRIGNVQTGTNPQLTFTCCILVKY